MACERWAKKQTYLWCRGLIGMVSEGGTGWEFGRRKKHNATTIWSKHRDCETCHDVLIDLTSDILGGDEGSTVGFSFHG